MAPDETTAEPAADQRVETMPSIDPSGEIADPDPCQATAGEEPAAVVSTRRESAHCSSGESDTRAKRDDTASAMTNLKAGGSSGGNGSGGDSRSGSAPEDGAQTSSQPVRAPPVDKPAGRGGKHKLARPEGQASCPRCNSGNTKFCYYNNYNIKQPRYFCKECQRYWTAGGILRNVPVGAGRRKSKSSATREQEKAAAAVAAKRDAQAQRAATSVLQAPPQPPLVLPPGLGGTGPGPNDSAGGLMPQMNSAYAEQLRYMMDPSSVQLAAAAAGMRQPGMMGMGGPHGGFDASAMAGYGGAGPAGMMGMAASSLTGALRLADASGASLATASGAVSGGEGLGAAPSGDGGGLPAAEDGGGGDGRRVRTKLEHSGLADPQGSGLSGMAGSLPPASSGGDDRHAEWAVAARAAERQQAATMAAQAQMAAAQAQMQQAAALQAQAHLHAAAAAWPGQAAASYGMAGAGMWPPYSYGNPNWAAAQLSARMGGSAFGGGDAGGTGSNTNRSGSLAADGGSGEQFAGGMMGGMPMGPAWNGMMPTGSAPMGMSPWAGAMSWGSPAADFTSGKGFNVGGYPSAGNGGGLQASSMGSGGSAMTGLQPPAL